MRFPIKRFAPLPRQDKKLRGAGDAVALVAKPVARALDRVLGTRLAKCGECKSRQEWLNEMMPFR